MKTIIKNIQCLVTCSRNNIKDAGIIENGYVLLDIVIKKGKIVVERGKIKC